MKPPPNMERLTAILARLRQHILKLKPSKCCLFQRQLTFLGFIVGEHGIACDPKKVSAVSDWPTPTSISEVRTFCGIAGYCRSFVKDFAKIAGPLHQLTKKNATTYDWRENPESAFNV